MKPQVLVLDEPTAGLDPRGRDEILGLIKGLHDKEGISIILVSHSMEDVANYADQIIVMDKGRIFMKGKPAEVFEHYSELEAIGLAAPQVTYIMHELKEKGIDVDTLPITVNEARKEILRVFGK